MIAIIADKNIFTIFIFDQIQYIVCWPSRAFGNVKLTMKLNIYFANSLTSCWLL